MYFIEKVFNPGKGYSAVFRQPGADSHCRLLHGYDLIFAVTLGAYELDARNWVFDFGMFHSVKEVLEKHFDHKLVVALNDPNMALISEMERVGLAEVTVLPQVGCEAFARWFFNQVSVMLAQSGQGDRVKVLNTKVWEHEGNMAGYAPDSLFGGSHAL